MTSQEPSTSHSGLGELSASSCNLLEQYKGVVFEHPSLQRALSAVARGIAPGMPPQIVLLLGPSGVGKTTLVDALVRRFARSPSPVVKVTCPPVRGRQSYDFGKTHWKLLAKAVSDPFARDHRSPDAVAARLRAGSGGTDGVATVDEYRLGVLDMLRERGVRAVVLDEAQHMTRVASARTQADQLDVVKHAVDWTGVSHVVSGTYETSVMIASSEQVGRRSLVVHFPPYGSSDPADREAFSRIFGLLVGALPLSDTKRSWDELGRHLPDVYLYSAGCVGPLKDWLRRALYLALEREQDFVDWSLMRSCALSLEALSPMANAIREYRESRAPTLKDIADALAFDPTFSTPRSRSKVSPRPKPGKRSPARDRVGVPADRRESA